MTTLLLTSRSLPDTQSLWRAAIGKGWDVVRVTGVRIPEFHGDPPFVVYTEEIFARTLAERVGLKLIEPCPDWLVRLPGAYAQRHIEACSMREARTRNEPAFVKPPNDKSFPADVYACGHDLPSDVNDSATVLIADPVEWEVEVRCFVAQRKVLTLSPYLRNGILSQSDGFLVETGELAEVHEFTETILADESVEFPDAVVLDVGRIRNRGWAVVELNAPSSSGIYGCDADAALTVIEEAAIPIS